MLLTTYAHVLMRGGRSSAFGNGKPRKQYSKNAVCKSPSPLAERHPSVDVTLTPIYNLERMHPVMLLLSHFLLALCPFNGLLLFENNSHSLL